LWTFFVCAPKISFRQKSPRFKNAVDDDERKVVQQVIEKERKKEKEEDCLARFLRMLRLQTLSCTRTGQQNSKPFDVDFVAEGKDRLTDNTFLWILPTLTITILHSTSFLENKNPI
jgi:hypothetical protein